MKIRTVAVLMAAMISLTAVATLVAQGSGSDIKCPVSGKAADKSHAVDFDGGKVYMCCDKCPAAFQGNSDKYAAKAHLQMVQTGQLKQTACPFTGRPMNPDKAIDVEGVHVVFCCDNCKGKAAKASGDEQVALIFKDTSKGFKPAGAQ